MATKRAATKKRVAPPAPPKTYLAYVMFDAHDVEGKDAATDNMEYINPKCVNDVEHGDLVAVYTFTGLKKVSKQVTFADAV